MLTGRNVVTRLSIAPKSQGLMIRIAAFLIVIGGTLAAGPAVAQFGNIFGNQPPPRPPADVPNGSFPAQPPPVQYPGENQGRYYPGQGQYQGQPPNQSVPPAPPPSSVQTQPLPPPPPPGGSVAPPPAPAQRALITPQPANPPSPQPADTSPQPDDTVVTETPTQKIANGRAVFFGLDKITGRIISFDAAIGETVQFGALQVTARACYTRPPTEATNTDAFVQVDEVTLQGEIKRIFSGWMFASSPGLHAVEHPIYDVWLTDCASPLPSPVAQAAQPAPASPATPAPAPPRQRQPAPPRQPAAPPVVPPLPSQPR
jgi:hypothetical protein